MIIDYVSFDDIVRKMVIHWQAICEYFMKLDHTERAKNGPYPHLHLLNKYIRNKQDGQLRGTSRNGQYSARYADFFKKMDIVKRLVGTLAEQNNVSVCSILWESTLKPWTWNFEMNLIIFRISFHCILLKYLIWNLFKLVLGELWIQRDYNIKITVPGISNHWQHRVQRDIYN